EGKLAAARDGLHASGRDRSLGRSKPRYGGEHEAVQSRVRGDGAAASRSLDLDAQAMADSATGRTADLLGDVVEFFGIVDSLEVCCCDAFDNSKEFHNVPCLPAL